MRPSAAVHAAAVRLPGGHVPRRRGDRLANDRVAVLSAVGGRRPGAGGRGAARGPALVDVRSLAAAEPFVTEDGSTIRELCGLPTGGTGNQSLAEATLEPGQATQRHYHREAEEIYFVLEGEGELDLEGERARLSAGDAVPIRPGAWHQLRNVGKGP